MAQYSPSYPPTGPKVYPASVGAAQFVGINYPLEIARGSIPARKALNKFGRSTNCDSGVATDIHDQANPTDDVALWVAPTAARTHQIKSSDAEVGGAVTLRIYGLVDWDTAEVSEDLTMNGTTDVPTVNEYVIIHQMRVIDWGVSGVNIGLITATADSDGTITAQIAAGMGQTQMAVYGVPSVQALYITGYYASLLKLGGTAVVDVALLVAHPDVEETFFTTKHTLGVSSVGSIYMQHTFNPYYRIPGPVIMKIQAISSANNADVSAGFDLVLETL